MTTFLKTLQQDIELLYRSVFESTLEGMEIIDGETCRVVTANQAMANIFGFASPEEMVGLNPLDYIPTEDRDQVARMIDQDILQNNLRLVAELRATTRDGRELWLSALGVRIEHQGRLAGLISVRDITAQKLREKKIEASREETRLLVENAGKAIVVVQDGVIKFANSKTTGLTGYPEKDLVSSPFTEFIHPDDQPTVAELYLRSLRGEEVPQGSIVRSIGKEGKVIWFGLKAVSFTWDEKPAVWLLMNDITERKRAEDSLRESEKRYRLLAENASDVIWVTDMNMRPTYLSPSVTRLLGYSMEEAMARGMQESLTPASLKAAADAIVSALDAERKGQKDAMSMIPALELEMVRKDGSIVWVASTVSFISGPDGQPMEIMGVTRDITERKKTEEALQSNERHFRALIENSSDAIIVVNLDGTNRYVSPSTGRMLGYKPDERIGASIFESVHPDDIQLAYDEFVRLLQNPGATSFMEVSIQHKDGIWHTIEARATNLFHDPAVEGIVVNLRDVTERKKAEQALAESEKRYRFMAENVSDVIWVIDMNLRPTYLSPSITKLTGYSLEETLARGMEKGLTPAALEAVSGIVMAELARKGEPNSATRLTPVAVEMERKDGSKIWAESAGTLLRGPDGQPIEIIGILRDITERKKAEETLQRREQRFRALTERSSDVILIVSAEGTVRYMSPSVKPVLGFSPEEAIGTSLLKYLQQETLDVVAGDFTRLLQNPGATMQTEIRVQHKDGTWHTLEGTATNLLHDPAVEGIVINYRDITERKKAEETLQHREQRFRALTEHSSDVILIVSAEGTVRYVSPSVDPVLGLNPEEAIGTSILEYIQQESLQLVADDFAKVLQNPGATMQTEIRIQHKDGTWRILEAAATNLLHDPAVEGIVINYRDITERRRVEEELKRQERHFRALTERSSDVIVVLDKNGTARYVSPSVEHALGITPAQSEGVGFLTSIHPDDVRQAAEDWDYLLKHPGGTTKGERRIRRPDGSWSYVEAIGYNLLDDPSVEGVVVNMRDINERKQAEGTIKESEARYRLLAENLSDVIWTMDTNLRYTYISPSITHLRGYTIEEAKAISMEDMMTPASLEAAMRIMAEEAAKEHTGQYDPNRTITMEVELYRKDGSTVWAENAVTYLRDSSGQITGYQGVSRDITERRETTKQLEQSFQNLERAMDGAVQAIALTVESRDRYTAGHQKRVAQLGCAMAQKLGYNSDQIRGIRIAALLHDIGKISVPQEILSKPGKLTDVEFRLIKAHSQTGYDILKSVEFPWPIADIVVQHHERMNGSGYPSGIREDKLLMEARILAVADVVEAMSSHRPYRAPLGVDKALEEISRNSGILYDPSVVNACMWVFNDKGFKFED